MPLESEKLTRTQRIDPKLTRARWRVALAKDADVTALGAPTALTEYGTANGPADYALCDRGAVQAVVEAKKLTLGPQGVLTQAQRYSQGITQVPKYQGEFGVPFLPDTPQAGSQAEDGSVTADQPDGDRPAGRRPDVDLRPALRLLLRSGGRGGGTEGHAGGSSAGRTTSGGGRSSGGANRSVGRVSRAAGRAGRLALAYSSGDRQTLERAGLDYDRLQELNDPVEIGFRIVEAAFETQPDSTIEDAEERDIVAAVVEWILESPDGQSPSPDEVVRKAIETIIADTVLTEVGRTIRDNGSTQADRQALETRIRDTAEVYAQQVTLTTTGASEREMADAIENGIRDLGRIFGVVS